MAAKVNIHRVGGTGSTSARILENAERVEYEADSLGRKIGVRKLTFLDVHEITLVLGDHAANEMALNQATAVASVVEIDGDQITRPTNALQLKALMKRLDFPGVKAAMTALARFAPIDEDKEEIKNSL